MCFQQTCSQLLELESEDINNEDIMQEKIPQEMWSSSVIDHTYDESQITGKISFNLF